MDNKRKVFLDWMVSKKNNKTISSDILEIVENYFLSTFDIDIWSIKDDKEFSIFYAKILSNRYLKKVDRKTYKILKNYGKYYKTFLLLQDNLERGIKLVEEEQSDDELNVQLDIKYKEELVQCVDFFSSVEIGSFFYYLYEYSKNNDLYSLLDVRSTIIGVKHNNERLRYYADKKAVIRFPKIDFEPTDLNQISMDSLSDFCICIDKVNDYFNTHKSEVTLLSESDNESNNKIQRKATLEQDSYSKEKVIKDHDSQRICWDVFETALLIEGFWKIENKKVSRNEVVKQLSQDLRMKAINQGLVIDDTFRNINGINLQLSNIARSFFPERSTIHRTAIFDEVSAIYISDRNLFNYILEHAHYLVGGIDSYIESKNSKDLYSEAYFFTFVKEEYSKRHKDDGKSHKAIHCAKKCVDVIKDINKLFDIDLFSIENESDVLNVKSKLNNYDKNQDYSWYIFALEQYRIFVVNSKNIVSKKEKKFSLSLSETDYYEYVKEEYAELHKNDGKSHKAVHYAQKCIDTIRTIDNLLSIELFSIISESDINDVKNRLDSYKDSIDYSWYMYALEKYRSYLKKKNLSPQETINDLVQGNSENIEDYKMIILDTFPDGFLFDNPLRKKKFIRRYEEILNKEFGDSDDLYFKKINLVGFISEGKVYLESIVTPELKNEIKAFIDESLKKTPAVFYSYLFEKFNNKFSSLFSEDMLKSYLRFVFPTNYSFLPDYLANIESQIDFKNVLIKVFIDCERPMGIEEICSILPGIPQSIISETIKDKDFIVNYRGKSYFYKDVFLVDDNQLDLIDKYIFEQLEKKEQISGSDIYSFILSNIHDLIDINPDVTDLGIKNYLKLRFETKYSFRGDVISKFGQDIDVKALFKDFCEQRERFSYSELVEYKDSINKTYIDWDAVMSSSIRIDQNSFIRRDQLNFKVDQIDKAIDDYCKKDYCSFVDVINYFYFPTLEVNWNIFLLESYIYLNSDKFKLIHASFNADKPVGAIVNIKSNINSFDDLLFNVIKDNRLFDLEKAFSYLIENDYIRTRKVKNIENLIERAKKEV